MDTTPFYVECVDAFRFLVTDHGFSGPEYQRGRVSESCFFTKGSVGIEVLRDHRESHDGLMLIELQNGSRPDVFKIGDGGRIVRLSVVNILLDLGKPVKKYYEHAEFTPQNPRSRWQAYAQMLRHELPSVLDGSNEVFDQLNATQ
jgi:hypothetical protein